ncbi:hypothetical protein CBL_21378, partial [Carabus blaptoides fortunei]
MLTPQVVLISALLVLGSPRYQLATRGLKRTQSEKRAQAVAGPCVIIVINDQARGYYENPCNNPCPCVLTAFNVCECVCERFKGHSYTYIVPLPPYLIENVYIRNQYSIPVHQLIKDDAIKVSLKITGLTVHVPLRMMDLCDTAVCNSIKRLLLT